MVTEYLDKIGISLPGVLSLKLNGVDKSGIKKHESMALSCFVSMVKAPGRVVCGEILKLKAIIADHVPPFMFKCSHVLITFLGE